MSESVPKIDNVPAIILCGGKSKRMGADKAKLMFGTSSMLHVVEKAFIDRCKQVFIVVGDNQEDTQPARQTTLLIRDEKPGLGPLEGLRVGLKACSEISDYAMVATCDSPFVNLAIYQRMLGQLHGNHQAVIPVIGDRPYPLTAVYHRLAVVSIDRMIDRGDLKVRNLMNYIDYKKIGKAELEAIDAELLNFLNINTPQEYQAALKRIRPKSS